MNILMDNEYDIVHFSHVHEKSRELFTTYVEKARKKYPSYPRVEKVHVCQFLPKGNYINVSKNVVQ